MWLHPLIAIDFAGFMDPLLQVQMTIWCARYLSGDPTLIPEVAANYDRNNGTKSITSMTTGHKTATHQKLVESQARVAQVQVELNNTVDELATVKGQAAKIQVELAHWGKKAPLLNTNAAGGRVDRKYSEL